MGEVVGSSAVVEEATWVLDSRRVRELVEAGEGWGMATEGARAVATAVGYAVDEKEGASLLANV